MTESVNSLLPLDFISLVPFGNEPGNHFFPALVAVNSRIEHWSAFPKSRAGEGFVAVSVGIVADSALPSWVGCPSRSQHKANSQNPLRS